MHPSLAITYVGGPTALLEISGLRLLTDPTFDAAHTEYTTPVYTLRKTAGPAIAPDAIGRVDAVLLSHDHHFDNLDRAGRALLPSAGEVITTELGARRLGGNAVGLSPWSNRVLAGSDGRSVRITATPARHGPADGDRGPVIGFLVTNAVAPESASTPAVYVSGDTVWYEGLHAVAEHGDVRAAVLFMGAARVREVGPAHLTFTADDAVEFARAFPRAAIVPLHYEGWEHFSEGRAEIARVFAAAGLADRLRWARAGERMTVLE